MSQSFQKIKSLDPTIHLRGDDGEVATKIEKEINDVIKSKVHGLSKRFGLDEDEEERLCNELTSMPNRTYLWVHLVWDMLERGLGISSNIIEEIVRDIPSTVHEAYEKILRRSTDSRKSRTLLQIVVGAERPLSLQEVAVAFAIACGCEPQALRSEPETRTRDTIRGLCGLFVTVIDSKVYLIHQTAKEFLQYSQSSKNHAGKFDWKASCDPLKSNEVLANACVKYLHFRAKSNFYLPPHLHFPADCGCEEDCGKDKFLAYSTEFWTNHVRGSSPCEGLEIEDRILDLCNVSWDGCLVWIQAYNKILRPWERLIPSDLTPLIVASYFGLDRIVRKLVQREDVQLNVKNARCRSALAWAAAKGHTKVVQELLKTAPNTTIKWVVSGERIDINSRDCHGQTPLALAAEKGHEAIVQLLLDNGRTEVDSLSRFGTPLHLAAEHGHTAIVRRLLSRRKANVNFCMRLLSQDYPWNQGPYSPSQTSRTMQMFPFLPSIAWDELFGEHSDTPFIWAAQTGRVDTMKIYLEMGFPDINKRGDFGMTALAGAAALGKAEVVKLLLERPSIAVDLADWKNRTPLALAAEEGKTEIIHLLLSSTKKPNVNHMCASGRTPLALASRRGYEHVVRALLESDEVDANLGKTPSETPLSLAMQTANLSIIQMLLNSGKVSFNPRSTLSRTPLYVVVQEGHVETLARLLREVDRKGSKGITSLLIAIKSGMFEIVEFLLYTEAVDVQATLAKKRPVLAKLLHRSAEDMHASVIRLLLEAGSVDVNAKDYSGTKSLEAAKERGFHHLCNIFSEFQKRQVHSVLVCSNVEANSTWLSAVKRSGTHLYDGLFISLDEDRDDDDDKYWRCKAWCPSRSYEEVYGR
ncbi:ankyrin repeat domain-containing protein 52 [Colletotrichum asianum]|uniref:Ankyrin repeat domain-containing protein 52 n=1 Tax=Colletotrichum asianum TaxID=702518 RepID=A0A8H3ZU30_9PEZI|nr:ankyrin repeat domain-containing protein 52 [Colletotrichum asianum]